MDDGWVYWHQQGKRHDKSFGRGEAAHQQAKEFDAAINDAKNSGKVILRSDSIPIILEVNPDTESSKTIVHEGNSLKTMGECPAACRSKGYHFG